VRVVSPVKVFHVPKQPEVQLEGMTGTVKKIAALHKGQVLSANLQYRVQFATQVNGADVKFFAHLVGGFDIRLGRAFLAWTAARPHGGACAAWPSRMPRMGQHGRTGGGHARTRAAPAAVGRRPRQTAGARAGGRGPRRPRPTAAALQAGPPLDSIRGRPTRPQPRP
jgi:hypothetical protein